MGEETLYEVLGVSSGASAEEIKRAYRQRCIEFHPDGLPDHREEIVRFANERMKLITLAWSVLSDHAKRRDYDETLRRGGPRTSEDSALEEEISRLHNELDAARKQARQFQTSARSQDAASAMLEELRRISAFQRMQAEMASQATQERAFRSGVTGTPNTPYEDFLEEERRREAERVERAKSPAQRARERLEREVSRAQWRAESRNALWGFLWRHSDAVKRAEARIARVEMFFRWHRDAFLFPVRAVRFLLRGVAFVLAMAIAAAMLWSIYVFVFSL